MYLSGRNWRKKTARTEMTFVSLLSLRRFALAALTHRSLQNASSAPTALRSSSHCSQATSVCDDSSGSENLRVMDSSVTKQKNKNLTSWKKN